MRIASRDSLPQKSKQLPVSKGTVLVSKKRVVLGIKSKALHAIFGQPILAIGQEIIRTNLVSELLVAIGGPEDELEATPIFALLALTGKGSANTNCVGEGILLIGIIEEDNSLSLRLTAGAAVANFRRRWTGLVLFSSCFTGTGRLETPAAPTGAAMAQTGAMLAGTLMILGTNGSCLIVMGEVSGTSMANKPAKSLWQCSMYTVALWMCVKFPTRMVGASIPSR